MPGATSRNRSNSGASAARMDLLDRGGLYHWTGGWDRATVDDAIAGATTRRPAATSSAPPSKCDQAFGGAIG